MIENAIRGANTYSNVSWAGYSENSNSFTYFLRCTEDDRSKLKKRKYSNRVPNESLSQAIHPFNSVSFIKTIMVIRLLTSKNTLITIKGMVLAVKV